MEIRTETNTQSGCQTTKITSGRSSRLNALNQPSHNCSIAVSTVISCETLYWRGCNSLPQGDQASGQPSDRRPRQQPCPRWYQSVSAYFSQELSALFSLICSWHFFFLTAEVFFQPICCLLYTSPSPRDRTRSRMPSSA